MIRDNIPRIIFPDEYLNLARYALIMPMAKGYAILAILIQITRTITITITLINNKTSKKL